MSGVVSVHLTTDTGNYLDTYSDKAGKSLTVKVKSTLKPVPAGGNGQLQVHWWVPEDCPADLVAFVDLSTDRIWVMTMPEVAEVRQQLSARGYHVTMYVKYIPKKTAKKRPVSEYERFLLENRFDEIFG